MRNDRAKVDRKFQPMTYGDVVLPILQERYGPLRNATKLLARDANATQRAAKNWLQGLCAPAGDNLLSLMAACEDLRAAVNGAALQRRAERDERRRESRNRMALGQAYIESRSGDGPEDCG